MHSLPRKPESSRGQRAGAAHRPCVHLGTCPQVSCEPGRRLTNLMLPPFPSLGPACWLWDFLRRSRQVRCWGGGGGLASRL